MRMGPLLACVGRCAVAWLARFDGMGEVGSAALHMHARKWIARAAQVSIRHGPHGVTCMRAVALPRHYNAEQVT